MKALSEHKSNTVINYKDRPNYWITYDAYKLQQEIDKRLDVEFNQWMFKQGCIVKVKD